MNQKSTFNRNFDKAILKTMNCKVEDLEMFKFKLNPIEEQKGRESSRDTWMKYAKLKNSRIQELKSYEETIWLLSSGNSNYPLWINISRLSDLVVLLEFSLRFRHIKNTRNQGTGHPPFSVLSNQIQITANRASICAADDVNSHKKEF